MDIHACDKGTCHFVTIITQKKQLKVAFLYTTNNPTRKFRKSIEIDVEILYNIIVGEIRQGKI